jgi:APA family basic amino acid/polyamine antiporter
MKNQIFAKKTLAMFERDMQKSGLQRVLGKWGLTSMGVGAVVGAGIFVMTGLAAKEYAGPALALSFIVAGLGCAFAALCYAEFASMIPVEGSAYAYSYATMGELFAWVIGWDLILEYAMSSATVAVGWSGYLAKLLGLFQVHFPIWLMNDLYTAKSLINQATEAGTLAELNTHYSSLAVPSIAGVDIAFNLPAFLVCLFITVLLCRGIKEASGTNNLMVIVKLAVILFVVVAGAFYIDVANWSPFVPARALNSEGNMSFGYFGILSGAAYVFFAYIGFDAVSTQAAEAINPKKDVPFGILVSLLICTVLYVLVSLVLTGMVKYTDLDITAPISAAFGNHGLHFAVWIISIAAVAGLTSVLLVTLLGQTRILLAMAKDGLLPFRIFGEIHPTFKTPFKGSLVVGLFVALVSSFTPIDTLANLVNIGTLLAFAMVCVAVWFMRIKHPDQPRAFKVPFLPVMASLGVLFNVGMMLSLEWENWVRLFAWLGIGLLVYFIYGYHNSVLAKAAKAEKIIQ